MQKDFSELNFFSLSGNLVILDVDGTIVEDGKITINNSSRAALETLKSVSDVYFCSNKKKHDRDEVLAASSGVSFIKTTSRKPDPRIIRGLGRPHQKKTVIGDKFLTDGIFAGLIGAQFIKVKRLSGRADTFPTKIICAFDDLSFFCYLVLKLIRPKHWLKNFLVFAPLFFAREIFDFDKLIAVGWLWLGFSLVASAVYIINDIFDRSRDLQHPVKCRRPLAAGDLSLKVGSGLAIVFLLLGVGIMRNDPLVAALLVFYAAANFAYSFHFKKIPIVDIIAVASFYLLRIVAGGLVADVHLSGWIVLCVFFVSLLLVIGKRRAEIAIGCKREVLGAYPVDFLDKILIVSASLTLVTYGIYTVLASASAWLVYSNVFVVWAIMRYIMLSSKNDGTEYPDKILFRDGQLLAAAVCWAIFSFIIFYK